MRLLPKLFAACLIFPIVFLVVYKYVPYQAVLELTFDVEIRQNNGQARYVNLTVDLRKLQSRIDDKVIMDKTRSLTTLKPETVLWMKLNVTLQSSEANLTMATKAIPFSDEGLYHVRVIHWLDGLKPGIYTVTIRFSHAFYEKSLYWYSRELYLTVF